MRFVAIVASPISGLASLPRNVYRLTLCTAPNQIPELMPGVPADKTEFSFRRYLEGLRRGDTPGKIISLIATPILFLPGWLYRISLKSTAWLWLPVIALGSYIVTTPRGLRLNPEQFERHVLAKKWTRVLRWKGIVSAALFLGTSAWLLWQESGGVVPREPAAVIIVRVVWSSLIGVPWQVAALLSTAFGLAAFFIVDSARVNREARRDDGTRDQASTQHYLGSIAFRIGGLCSMLYVLGLIGWAGLKLNQERCFWHPVPAEVQEWVERIYGTYSPAPPADCPSRVRAAAL